MNSAPCKSVFVYLCIFQSHVVHACTVPNCVFVDLHLCKHKVFGITVHITISVA
jgi:hypothetical protein